MQRQEQERYAGRHQSKSVVRSASGSPLQRAGTVNLLRNQNTIVTLPKHQSDRKLSTKAQQP